MHEGLVSVIMPTFNCSLHLADSIDSILNQTYQNVELLITDDHSTDEETLSILRRYCEQDERVDVLFLEENKGPGYARDHSIERARGQYIAFCDSDDRWFPEKLERQIGDKLVYIMDMVLLHILAQTNMMIIDIIHMVLLSL